MDEMRTTGVDSSTILSISRLTLSEQQAVKLFKDDNIRNQLKDQDQPDLLQEINYKSPSMKGHSGKISVIQSKTSVSSLLVLVEQRIRSIVSNRLALIKK